MPGGKWTTLTYDRPVPGLSPILFRHRVCVTRHCCRVRISHCRALAANLDEDREQIALPATPSGFSSACSLNLPWQWLGRDLICANNWFSTKPTPLLRPAFAPDFCRRRSEFKLANCYFNMSPPGKPIRKRAWANRNERQRSTAPNQPKHLSGKSLRNLPGRIQLQSPVFLFPR